MFDFRWGSLSLFSLSLIWLSLYFSLSLSLSLSLTHTHTLIFCRCEKGSHHAVRRHRQSQCRSLVRSLIWRQIELGDQLALHGLQTPLSLSFSLCPVVFLSVISVSQDSSPFFSLSLSPRISRQFAILRFSQRPERDKTNVTSGEGQTFAFFSVFSRLDKS